MRIFRGRSVGGKDQFSEKTVVRPTFSYMGEFFISDSVMTDIAKCVARESDGVVRVLKVYENTAPDNLIMDVAVSVSDKTKIWECACEFQKRLAETVESMTAFNVTGVNVEVRGIEKQ